MTTIIVKNSRFISHSPVNIPKGTVKAELVDLQLDKSWDGMSVFIHWHNLGTNVEKRLLLKDPPQQNEIPWEVLNDLGELRMGLVGMDGETTVKPTIWLTFGRVVEGPDADGGEDTRPPTPGWAQQMVEQATAAAEAAKAAQEAAEQAGPYAKAAQASADAAKASEVSAAASAQAAGQSQAETEQAKISALGYATAAQQAQAAAQQAAQQAQIAKESGVQSAKTAAADAKRAETASQEAQEAADRAEAVDAYHRQDANDRFALALKTETGKGTSHEIYPDAGSNIVVTAYGFTEQVGAGDPSPDNVRPIKVGGLHMVEREVIAADDFYKFSDSANPAVNTTPHVKDSGLIFSDRIRGYVFKNRPTSPSRPYFIRTGELKGVKVFFYAPEENSKSYEESLEYYKKIATTENPLKMWYVPESAEEATGRYAVFLADGKVGDTFSSGAVKLNKPLCDGDYIVSDRDGQCVEVHSNLFFELTGAETLNFYETYVSLDVGVDTKTDSKNSLCSIAKFNTSSGGDGFYFTGRSVVFGSEFVKKFGGGLAFVQKLKDLYANGNPVQLQIPLASPITHTHSPVPLIAKPDSTGKVTVSGEKEVSVIYNKSIKRAIDEINAAILELGGTQNV